MAQPGDALRRLLPRAHVARRSTVDALDFGPLPADDWALDGSTGGTGRARLRVAARHHQAATSDGGYDLAQHYAACAARTEEMLAGIEPLVETGFTDDADVVVVAFGTPGEVRARRGRAACGPKALRVGFVRPITLLPFPSDAIAGAADRCRAVVGVYENNQGQMVDDVRLAVLGRAPVAFIGGLSLDGSGFGIAPDLDGGYLRGRIEEVLGMSSI